LLIVVANNRSYYNDVVHQERVARDRGRPIENKWLGQQIDGPAVDLLGIARAQGAVVIGPATDMSHLGELLAQAVAETRKGRVCVVDVLVAAEYGPALTAVLSPNSAGLVR
jgi:hypothetical protein